MSSKPKSFTKNLPCALMGDELTTKTLKLPQELHDAAKRVAREAGMQLSPWIRHLMAQAVKKAKAKEAKQ